MQRGEFLLLGQVNVLSKTGKIGACWEWFVCFAAKIYLWGNFHTLLMSKWIDFHLLIALSCFRRGIWADGLLPVYLLKTPIENLYLGTRLLLSDFCFGSIIAHQYLPSVCVGANINWGFALHRQRLNLISFMFTRLLNIILVT